VVGPGTCQTNIDKLFNLCSTVPTHINVCIVYNLEYFHHVLIKKLLCSLSLVLQSTDYHISCWFAVIYDPQKNKSVVLLSLLHHQKDISNEDHKNDTILLYNARKTG